MRKRITLVSTDAGPAHNCGLATGLKKYGEVTTVWENKSPHKLDYLVPDAKYGYQNIPPKGDDLIIAGCLAFDRVGQFQYDRVHVIISDGRFARNPDYYNEKFQDIDVLAHACKYHFRYGLPTKTYFQPFDLSKFDETKNDKITVAHSPFGPGKRREKGSSLIFREVFKHKADYDLISGVSWDECLTRKAKAHIFVDQVSHYDRDKFKFRGDYVWPALGKSGLEAMHLGCLVITYGEAHETEIPSPPVAWVKEKTFAETLAFYIHNEREREELALKGQEWALEYATYDYAAQNVLR